MANERARKKQAERTRQLLFEKGTEVLRNVHDPDDFTVEEITDACGVSKGTFYLYFKTKGAFFYNVKMTAVLDARNELMAMLQDERIPTRDAILNFVHRWLYYIETLDIQAGKNWLSFLVDDESRDTADLYDISVSAYLTALEQRLARGVERKELLADTPVTCLAQSIMVVLHGLDTLNIITDKGLDFACWSDQAVRMVDDGVLKRWMVVHG